MDPHAHTTTSGYESDSPSGRSVIPRRLPPLPSLSSLRTHSPSSSTSSTSSSSPSSIFSGSSSSSPGATSPALSSASASPSHSPQQVLSSLKRASRPLPQIPGARRAYSPSLSQSRLSPSAHQIVCRNCMNCVTTPEGLLPATSVPLGSRAFRGFSGKASLFTQVFNVTSTPPRVQLMTTGAHTMQEIFCENCSGYLGWKIVKAHERTERWKEGKWLLELENLWVARSSDVSELSFGNALGREREWAREKVLLEQPRGRRGSDFGAAQEYPKDALGMVNAARERGLGLEFADPESRSVTEPMNHFLHSPPSHHHSKSIPSFRAYGTKSAIHLPMTVAS